MPLFWHSATRDDFRAIRRFYNDLDPSAQRRLIKAIFEAARHLTQHPNLGRTGRVEGTRELLVKGTRFLLGYTVAGDRIIVLAVYHSLRRWPDTWFRAAVEEAMRQADAGQFASEEEVRRFFDELEGDEPKEGANPRSTP